MQFTLTEAKPEALPISREQALALNQLGKELASKKPWWGNPSIQDTDEQYEPSLIRCLPTTEGGWEIVVANAVGLIRVDNLTIYVQPKIPLTHAVYLFEQSEQFPRLSKLLAQGGVAQGTLLWQAMAQWLIWSVEAVLRGDLRKDYRHDEDNLLAARGRISTHQTAIAFCHGSVRMHCEFDEFDEDNALNRLLKASLKVLPQIGGLNRETLNRSKRALARLAGVGELRTSDLHATVDRNAFRYSQAISLAKHVILGFARTIQIGSHSASCFLLRTPDLIEAGIRNILKQKLMPLCLVEKRGFQINKTPYTFNPDLVFGNTAVGDVKYKIGNDWIRSDLYQSIAFAVAFGVPLAMIHSVQLQRSVTLQCSSSRGLRDTPH